MPVAHPHNSLPEMRYSLLTSVFFVLVAGAVPAVVERDDKGCSQPKICSFLPVRGGGCIRCNSPSHAVLSAVDILDVRGFDVTGVTTDIDLTFPDIKDECDCINACLVRKNTCNNYVWKFSDDAGVKSGYRTCTLCNYPFPHSSILSFLPQGSLINNS